MKTKLIIPLLLGTISLCIPTSAPAAEDVRWQIKALAKDSAFEEAIALGAKALAERPDDVDLLVLHATNLVTNCDSPKAIPLLERASCLVPQSDRARAYSAILRKLGEANFHIGNYAEASNCFELAQRHPDELQVLNTTIAQYGLSTTYRQWTIIETEHLRFHFGPELSPEFKREFAASREASFVAVNEFFKATLPKKIDFFAWSSLEEAKKTAGIAQLGFAVPRACIVHSRTNQTRGHEITHVVSRHALHPRRVTRLVNEGVAVYFDLSGKDRLAAARESVRKTGTNPISLAALWTEKPGTTSESPFYSVAGAFIERIHQKGGDEKLRQLCADQTYEAAKKIYGGNLDLWISEFENEINAE